MRIGSSTETMGISGIPLAERIDAARLTPQAPVSLANVPALQQFYGQVLGQVEGVRNGQVGGCAQVDPALWDRLFDDPPECRQILDATAPNWLDNEQGRELRRDYRVLLRECRRERTRAVHQGGGVGQQGCEWRADDPMFVRRETSTSEGDSRVLELNGTRLRHRQSTAGSVRIEDFRLDEKGNPVREVILPERGVPTRTTALPDGSSTSQLPGCASTSSPARRTPAAGQNRPALSHPWWRERDPNADWEGPPARPADSVRLAGFSPNHSQRIADTYQEIFGADLAADIKSQPATGEALQSFAQRTQAAGETPKPAATPAVAQDTQALCTSLTRLFDRLDKNKNGKISKSEVKEALKDPKIKGDDAAALAALLGLMEAKEGLEGDFTREKLTRLQSGQSGTKIDQKAASYFSYYRSRLNNQSRKVVEGTPNPFQLEQGQFGTCYFLAALVSKAQQDPGSIAKMIKDNGNGTFTVTFPGHKAVTIDAPSDGELLTEASSGSNGTWATILEKAYAKMKNDEAFFSRDNPMDKVEGGGTGQGISDLTTSSVDTDELWLTRKSTTRKKLIKALGAGKMVVASVSKDWIRDSGIPDQHAYTVLDYNEKTDKITLRNPWGHTETKGADGRAKDGNDDGIFQMTLDEFDKTFSIIAYEE